MTKEEYYQKQYDYWTKVFSAPGVRVVDTSIEKAAERVATNKTNKWWIGQMGPQIKKCCNEFVQQFHEFDYDKEPTEVSLYNSSTIIHYCPFCGTKITPWRYYSPEDNPFNKPEASTPQ